MTMATSQTGMFTARHAVTGAMTTFFADSPNVAAGDGQFLDMDRAGKILMRPLLKSERTPTSVDEYPPGAYWLIYFSETGKQLRAIVKLPFNRRKTTEANITYAIAQVAAHHSGFGTLFRLAQDGIDPFQAILVFDDPTKDAD